MVRKSPEKESLLMAYKRATGKTGMAKSYTGNMISSKGNKSASDGGSVPSKPGNPRTGMGTKKGTSINWSQGGRAGEHAKGRSRTRRGKNNTGSGPQGFRG